MGDVMPDSGFRGRVLVSARDVSREFFRKGRQQARYFNAVDHVSLDLHEGELCVVMGRSGSGKSTLLNMLSGLLEPTEGVVMAGETDLYKLDDVRLSRLRNETFGIIPQGQTAVHSLTVVQNVCLPYELYRKGDSAEKRAFELLESLSIADLADCFPSELSGGEMRRMAIARALICNPSVVFADEPTSDLDDENTRLVMNALRDVAHAGSAVFMVTHEQAAADLADALYRMDAGTITSTSE